MDSLNLDASVVQRAALRSFWEGCGVEAKCDQMRKTFWFFLSNNPYGSKSCARSSYSATHPTDGFPSYSSYSKDPQPLNHHRSSRLAFTWNPYLARKDPQRLQPSQTLWPSFVWIVKLAQNSASQPQICK
jgi:hypothetical protein